ncbi:hypothetical protein B296_00058018 [Ensete ventricosum]|uniref:Uncharacterized protein n=1 Tax=Ensete ventricosum TaxID=4639 RepID=A0A426X6G4_ENSVE|nr:hypothetical protein B296_00058018 [Ensete ventricosum]
MHTTVTHRGIKNLEDDREESSVQDSVAAIGTKYNDRSRVPIQLLTTEGEKKNKKRAAASLLTTTQWESRTPSTREMPIIKKTAKRNVTRKDDGGSKKPRGEKIDEWTREGEKGDVEIEKAIGLMRGLLKESGTPRAAAGVTDLTSTVDASSDG